MASELSPILLAREFDRADLRRRLRAGDLLQIRRGAYIEKPTRINGRGEECPVALTERDRLILHARAVSLQMTAPHQISHDSAALLWGLKLWKLPSTTNLRTKHRSGTRSADDFQAHLQLHPYYTELSGAHVTTLHDTVIDCLLTMPPLDGLCVLDSALGQNVAAEKLNSAIGTRTLCRGVPKARTLLTLGDGGADNPWETWLRYRMLRLGLPRPVTQYQVVTRMGTRYIDLACPEHGAYFEFDGAWKYRDGTFDADYRGSKALLDEKRREDALVEVLGVRPLRVTARDAQLADLDERILSKFPASVRKTARIRPSLPLPVLN